MKGRQKRMNKKKILKSVVVIGLCASMLAGCAAGGAKDDSNSSQGNGQEKGSDGVIKSD